MSIRLIMMFLLVANHICAQKTPEPITGTIKIKAITSNYWQDEKTNKNKVSRYVTIHGLDIMGNITETILYNKYNPKFKRIINSCEFYKYNGNNIICLTEYNPDYLKRLDTTFKTIYYYNNQQQLIRQDRYYYPENRINNSTAHTYTDSGKIAIEHFSPGYYHRTLYDAQRRISKTQQIYKNDLRWEKTYDYTDTTREMTFKSYDEDRNNDSIYRETVYYKDGIITECTDHVMHRTIKFCYNKAGMLTKVERHSNYYGEGYKLYERINYKTRQLRGLNKQTISKINGSLIARYIIL